ncbi:transcriptional regulator, HxlR family [Chitinophaga jiangningensis]|uniref:Transcriptional regulator, HxlR family n=1 Tax=Chitinophaga jiangningensis TaxID=1419482 RepID=A0A1M7CNW4_9BACT|nr:helix-turn-helix domain-containing protein [Chitinophaga jiangningensis]SHL68895.1 transcriptional regulator, HxlR family [Chitinophaga jiangningensis]
MNIVTPPPAHTAAGCNAALNAVGDALYVIGGKWKMRIIVVLRDGSKRFNDLQRSVTGISARVLSNELKDLEINGFVKRVVDANATPVVVTYELMPYADTLKEVIASLHNWGVMHRNKLMQKITP